VTIVVCVTVQCGCGVDEPTGALLSEVGRDLNRALNLYTSTCNSLSTLSSWCTTCPTTISTWCSQLEPFKFNFNINIPSPIDFKEPVDIKLPSELEDIKMPSRLEDIKNTGWLMDRNLPPLKGKTTMAQYTQEIVRHAMSRVINVDVYHFSTYQPASFNYFPAALGLAPVLFRSIRELLDFTSRRFEALTDFNVFDVVAVDLDHLNNLRRTIIGQIRAMYRTWVRNITTHGPYLAVLIHQLYSSDEHRLIYTYLFRTQEYINIYRNMLGMNHPIMHGEYIPHVGAPPPLEMRVDVITQRLIGDLGQTLVDHGINLFTFTPDHPNWDVIMAYLNSIGFF